MCWRGLEFVLRRWPMPMLVGNLEVLRSFTAWNEDLIILSSIVLVGSILCQTVPPKRPGSSEMYVISFLRSERLRLSTSIPFRKIEESDMLTPWIRQRKTVLLPLPVCPTIPIRSPALIEKDTSLRISGLSTSYFATTFRYPISGGFRG